MEAETFNPLMISVRRDVFSVQQEIDSFTAEHVSLDLKDEIPTRLNQIDNCNKLCQEKIFDLLMKLDENVPSDAEKINTLRKLADETKSKVFNNSLQVRSKLSDLIRNKPRSLTEQEAFDRLKQKEDQEEST